MLYGAPVLLMPPALFVPLLARSAVPVTPVVLRLPGDVTDVLLVLLDEDANVLGAKEGKPALRLPQAACT
jgi:hypothetical protein